MRFGSGVDSLKKNYFNRGSSEFDRFRIGTEEVIESIREEIEDHKETINDNTSEIQANHEYAWQIDQRLKRMEQRLEHLESWMARSGGFPLATEERTDFDLDEQEKKIFLIIYTASNSVTYSYIAEALDESELQVKERITSMLEKGVPIQKRYSQDNEACLMLEKSFKDEQAKHNIVRISQRTVKEFLV